MSDSFEFTLNSPLTQEDWNKISDAELENTTSITFQTPQGRQVKYIKYEVLDNIKAEIANHLKTMTICDVEKDNGVIVQSELTNRKVVLYDTVLQIIDKYKAEGSGEA